MKAILGFLVFFACVLALASSCKVNWPRLEGMCIHQAVMGGMPFALPEGSHFTGNGQLVIETEEGLTFLTGATCYFRTVR